MKTLFYLPLHIFNLLSLLLPFNVKGYQPASESVRLSEQALRNKAHLAAYKAKRLINRK